MRGLAETISRLGEMRASGAHRVINSRLIVTSHFGNNPGDLTMKAYVPDELAGRSPLLVVLHGCTQNAEIYDQGSGWSALANELGFALLFPEQKRTNNPNLCFNWFQPSDITRGSGEAASIHEMIVTMISTYDLDPAKVFITGLSAGGAMTAEMLAAYPDVFASGAVIAGLPAGSAKSISEALQQMRRPRQSSLQAVHTASHRGPWPTISVWHGDHDQIVAVENADLIVEQWRSIHGAQGPAKSETVNGHRRSVWSDAYGREVIERYHISGMGHGVPLATTGPSALGIPAPHMLDAGISSTRSIARFFGLENLKRPSKPRPTTQTAPAGRLSAPVRIPASAPRGPGAVIESALRAAGLMR